MKFKILFLIFVGLILFSSFVLLFMPFFLLGADYAFSFWSSNWYLLLLLFVLLAVLVIFYLKNKKMFYYLEEENWDSLLNLLYESIIVRHKFRSEDIKLFILLCVLKNRFKDISELSALLKEKKPSLRDEFYVELGLPYIKAQDADIIIPYYKDALSVQKGKARDWSAWFFIYGLLLKGDYAAAKDELLKLLSCAKEPLVVLVALHSLNAFSSSDTEVADFVNRHRENFRKNVSRDKILKLIDTEKADIYILIMSKLIQDAVEWVFV